MSVQHWQNGVKPSTVGENYVGEYNIDDVEGQSARGKNAKLSWVAAARNETIKPDFRDFRFNIYDKIRDPDVFWLG